MNKHKKNETKKIGKIIMVSDEIITIKSDGIIYTAKEPHNFQTNMTVSFWLKKSKKGFVAEKIKKM